MSFLIQNSVGRGLTLTQIPLDQLRIGRGTNQELRSENPAVALEHAIIEDDGAGYVITDRGSITGTYVNGRPVESARLSKGDVVEIGDLRIDVQLADSGRPLFLRLVSTRPVVALFEDDEEEEPKSAVAAPGRQVVRAKAVDYISAFRLDRPWLTKITITAILLIVALGVVGEVIRPQRQSAFMPGGVSSAHARAIGPDGKPVADNCGACHVPWKSVLGSKCLDCHRQQRHSEIEKDAPECFVCHSEHRGATKLAATSDQRCVGCHADLENHVRVPKAELVSLRFGDGRYTFADVAKASELGQQHPEFHYPPDRDRLRFNHKLHLAAKGVFNASGKREVLACTACHAMVAAGGKMEPTPIDFGKHCQRCHRLTFDARFPDAEVPHGGDPGIVFGYIGNIYSGNRDLVGKPPELVRRILASRKSVPSDARAQIAYEHVIKTKCQKCHDIEQRGGRLAVTPATIPAHWLTKARFSHASHEQVACEKCHQGARESSATSDVLLPHRATCAECHAAHDRTAASTCLTCHEYHSRPKLQNEGERSELVQAGMGGLGGGGRMLQGILLAVIVVLVLVVLVPVGVALYQRLRPERTAAPRESVPPPPMPTMKLPALDVSTDKVGKVRSPPPPDLAPPSVRETRVILPDQPKAEAGAPGGTEMVQWYGMLHCTGGPLEGQRFIVEEGGLYIGRDPSLAMIVVPDNRISKRHVRILPRDGKVWAIDEGSTNGTFLRDQRITEVQLKRGDTLVLGDNAATFVYQI